MNISLMYWQQLCFSRIPVTWSKLSDESPDLARASWAFTLVGFIVGLLSGLIGDIILILGLTPCCLVS